MIAYCGATVIDGTGATARPETTVLVDGDVISAVGRSETVDLAPATECVDLSGQFLLPGLIDTHQHLATPPDRPFAEAMLRRDLYGGITAVRDMADDLRLVGDLTRATLVGELAGPDIYYAALMAGPSFFDDPRTWEVCQGAIPGAAPWMQAITEDTDLPLAVARAAGTNAVAIKIYANLPAVLVQAITAEAHRQGLLVWAHGMVFPATPAEVIQAGVDSVSHVNYLAYQASERRPTSYQGKFPIEQAAVAGGDNAVLAGLFEQMRQRGTVLDATNRLYAGADAELGAALTRQAFQAGVDICTGTDGFSADEDPFPALYDELRILHENVGMPAEQVIRSATLVGAMSLGQVHTMGTIEPGKLANFAVLAENPLLDMGNLRSITCTVKRGRRYERTEYATC